MLKNKNKLIGFLTVLSLFVFGLTLSPTPTQAYAIVGSGFYALESHEPTKYGPAVTNTGVTNGDYTANGAYNSNTKPTATTKTVTNASNSNAVGPSATTKEAMPLSVNTKDSNSNLNLSANAGSSKFSFMPNTLLGWLLLFTIIFLAIILWRKIYVTDEEKNKPLKHA